MCLPAAGGRDDVLRVQIGRRRDVHRIDVAEREQRFHVCDRVRTVALRDGLAHLGKRVADRGEPDSRGFVDGGKQLARRAAHADDPES